MMEYGQCIISCRGHYSLNNLICVISQSQPLGSSRLLDGLVVVPNQCAFVHQAGVGSFDYCWIFRPTTKSNTKSTSV